jgi:predicted DNA-binding transcriptional regulator AlpA
MSDERANELLTLDQIKQEYGVHRSTIYRYTRAGEITSLRKVGDRHAYYRRGDIERLVQPRPRKPRGPS